MSPKFNPRKERIARHDAEMAAWALEKRLSALERNVASTPEAVREPGNL